MGFKSVYQALKELFPQVDSRLLKAVAIEHSKDPDAAVEYVLSEVLPYIGDKCKNQPSAIEDNRNTGDTSKSIEEDNTNASGLWDDGHNCDNDSLSSSFYDAKDTDDLLGGHAKNEELILVDRREESNRKDKEGENLSASPGPGESSRDSCNQDLVHDGDSVVLSHERESDHVVTKASVSSSVASGADDDSDATLDGSGNVQLGCVSGLFSDNTRLSTRYDSPKEQQSLGCNLVGCDLSAGIAFRDHLQDGLSSNGHPENGKTLVNDIQDLTCFVDTELSHELTEADAVGATGVDTLSSTILAQSGQICRVNLLEDIIEEARNYKDTVFSAMESVLRLMEEVELQEKEAEQAKVADARGGLDILEKVEEIKKILKHAKEANEMHAGEVYGEKSILTTEVRELQLRLFSLSDEKEKSLSILDEMRRGLEDRLATAEQLRKAAEQDLFDKQENARGALTEQELIMDKVVQESKVLQQEAEENAKLRDFLMEKGRVVDILQGEISVICQDVKSLKENFDNNHSLSKSLSFEQTSCRLASSDSTVKSMASLKSAASLDRTASLKSTTSPKSSVLNPATEQMEFPESPAKMSRASSISCQSPKSNAGDEAVRHEARKPFLDDDWELCDMI